MQRGGSDSCSPWWERFAQVAEQGGDGCSFRTLERIECKVEYDPDTKQPNRKCQRILQKFRECPGRPTEVLETAVTRTDLGDDEPLFREGPQSVLESNMGEAMEEFFRIAEEINRSLVDEGPAADAHVQEQPDNSPRGLFMRWFGRERTTREPGSHAVDDEELWQQYKSKFEEV